MSDSSDINAVKKHTAETAKHPQETLKLPDFNRHEVAYWLYQVDLHLDEMGIKDSHARFVRLLSALPVDVSNNVRDVVTKPVKADPYAELKDALTSRYAESEQE